MACEAYPTENSTKRIGFVSQFFSCFHTQSLQAQSKYLSVIFFLHSFFFWMIQAKQNETKQSTNLNIFVWLIYVLSHTKRGRLEDCIDPKSYLQIKVCQKFKTLKMKSSQKYSNLPHWIHPFSRCVSVYVYVFWIYIYLFYQELTSNFTKSAFHFTAFVAILFVHILRTFATVTRAIFWDITIVFSITAYSTLFTKLQIIFFLSK